MRSFVRPTPMTDVLYEYVLSVSLREPDAFRARQRDRFEARGLDAFTVEPNPHGANGLTQCDAVARFDRDGGWLHWLSPFSALTPIGTKTIPLDAILAVRTARARSTTMTRWRISLRSSALRVSQKNVRAGVSRASTWMPGDDGALAPRQL